VYGYWTVKAGESLSKIAKDVYDDGNKYMKIYAANKATIGDNPNLVKPGQKLVLPKP
jgi:nucleoid-associated protein YgaU